MKTTKISKGKYKGECRGQKFIIQKTKNLGKTIWVWLINGEEMEDCTWTKKDAIDSVLYQILNSKVYGIKLV